MTNWIDFILALIAVEAGALLLWRRRTGRGPSVVIPNLLAGAMLLLAMRLALTEVALAWVGLALLGGLAAHLADLWARWR